MTNRTKGEIDTGLSQDIDLIINEWFFHHISYISSY
jgi:hypothetical protein